MSTDHQPEPGPVVSDRDLILPRSRVRKYPKTVLIICGGFNITISGLIFVLCGVGWASFPESEFSTGYGTWSGLVLLLGGISAVVAGLRQSFWSLCINGTVNLIALCVAVPSIIIFSAEGFIHGEISSGIGMSTGFVASQSVMLVYGTLGGAAAICCIGAAVRGMTKEPRPTRVQDMPDDQFNVGGPGHGLFNYGYDADSPPSYDIICPPPAYVESPTSTEIPHINNNPAITHLPPYERHASSGSTEVTSYESTDNTDDVPHYCLHNSNVPLHRREPEGMSDQEMNEGENMENGVYVPTLDILCISDPILGNTNNDISRTEHNLQDTHLDMEIQMQNVNDILKT